MNKIIITSALIANLQKKLYSNDAPTDINAANNTIDSLAVPERHSLGDGVSGASPEQGRRIEWVRTENKNSDHAFIFLHQLFTLQENNQDDIGFEVTIAADQSVTLIDNLEDTTLNNKPITFIIEKNATLFYRLCEGELFDKKKDENSILTAIDKRLTIKLVGAGAYAKITCLCIGRQKRVIAFKTVQHHIHADTRSDLLIKGVWYDQSKLISENLIRIEPNAQKVVATEVNKNIIMSDDARVISIPKLEVEADDVSCQHGAAISKLNDEHLFYLQSRGLSLFEAQKTLIYGFLSF